MSVSAQTEAAAQALADAALSDDEKHSALQFLCGYCPDAIHAAVARTLEIRALTAAAKPPPPTR
jgi:hypothetical protein